MCRCHSGCGGHRRQAAVLSTNRAVAVQRPNAPAKSASRRAPPLSERLERRTCAAPALRFDCRLRGRPVPGLDSEAVATASMRRTTALLCRQRSAGAPRLTLTSLQRPGRWTAVRRLLPVDATGLTQACCQKASVGKGGLRWPEWHMTGAMQTKGRRDPAGARDPSLVRMTPTLIGDSIRNASDPARRLLTINSGPAAPAKTR